MEKYLSKQQVKVILEQAPKGTDGGKIVDGLVSRGYKLEGFNDQAPTNEQQVASAPRSELTPEQKMQRDTSNAADFVGGKQLAQGIGQTIANQDFQIIGQEKKLGVQNQLAKIQDESIGIQNQLITQIKSNKALGKDTSKLESALKQLNQHIGESAGEVATAGNVNNLTDKEVVGSALQLATTVAGGKATGAISKAVGTGTGILAGAGKGALTGALSGGALGASYGTAQGLKDNKDASGIAGSAGIGALGGAVTGGVIGAVTGGITGNMAQNKLTKGQEYLKAVTPNPDELSTAEYEKLVSQGKIIPKTATTPAQYVLSDEEKLIASKYKNILTNDPVKNTINIVDEISKKDKEVGTFLKKNNGIFNNGELKNSLADKLAQLDDLTVSEEKLVKAKQGIIDNFMKSLKKNDMESLWTARKDFDRQIEKAFSGSPTLSKTMKVEFRNAIQDFIAERTPNGVYKGYMKDMSQLFNLKDITTAKSSAEKGMNSIQLWIKRNPTKAKAVGWTAGTGVAGTLLGSALKD